MGTAIFKLGGCESCGIHVSRNQYDLELCHWKLVRLSVSGQQVDQDFRGCTNEVPSATCTNMDGSTCTCNNSRSLCLHAVGSHLVQMGTTKMTALDFS